MKSNIKKMMPAWIKRWIKSSADMIDWIIRYKKIPIILENKFGIKFILYPWNLMLIRLAISGYDCEKEFMALKKITMTGNTVFDIGANMGVLSVYLSRLVQENGKVYSFEPVKDTYEMLRETISINRCENIETHPLAISDKIGISEIYKFDQRNHTLNSLGRVKIGETSPSYIETIRTETIDNFCQIKFLSKIDLLKIDVEGFEYDVLRGAENMLKTSSIKYIQFEISKMPLESLGKSADKIFDLLHSYGYKTYKFNAVKEYFEGPIQKADTDFDNYYASQEDLTRR
jgi:FkbM family methyltransferase